MTRDKDLMKELAQKIHEASWFCCVEDSGDYSISLEEAIKILEEHKPQGVSGDYEAWELAPADMEGRECQNPR